MKLHLKARVKRTASYDMDTLVAIQSNRGFRGLQKAVLAILRNEKISFWYWQFLHVKRDNLQTQTMGSYVEPKSPSEVLSTTIHFEEFIKDPNMKHVIAAQVPTEFANYQAQWAKVLELRIDIADLLSVPQVEAKALEFLQKDIKTHRTKNDSTAAKYLMFLKEKSAAWSSWFKAMYAFETFLPREDRFLREMVGPDKEEVA